MKQRIRPQDHIALIALIVLFVVFSITSGGILFSTYNLMNIFDQTLQTLVGGLGVIFVIAMGSTDLTIGGNAAVSVTLGCIAAERTGQFWVMIPVTLLSALVIGMVSGVIITRFRVSSFMCTLAMLIALRGFLNVLIEGKLIYAPAPIKNLDKFGWKMGVFLVLLAVMFYLFECTKIGRYAKAIGENERAAQCIGIDTARMRFIAFALSGLMAGFVGMFQIAKLGGSGSSMGQFMEMRVMMAIFLGGVLVSGGTSARIYKLVIGAFTGTIIINGLILSNVSTDYSQAVQGILLILVLFATLRSHHAGARKKA